MYKSILENMQIWLLRIEWFVTLFQGVWFSIQKGFEMEFGLLHFDQSVEEKILPILRGR